MTDILSKLQARKTGYRSIDGLTEDTIMGDIHTDRKHITDQADVLSYMTEYRMETSVGVRYRLRSDATAQAEMDAHNRARRVLAETLFAEVHEAITKTLAAIWNGDKRTALEILDELRNDITETHEHDIRGSF